MGEVLTIGDGKGTGISFFGAMMETITVWLAGGLAISRDELIDNAADLAVTLVETAHGRPSGQARSRNPLH